MTVDFDIVDDDVITKAVITESGCMLMGKAKYKHIIIPENAYIPEDTKKALERFSACGGVVAFDFADVKPVLKAEGSGLRAMHRKAENEDIFIDVLLGNDSDVRLDSGALSDG